MPSSLLRLMTDATADAQIASAGLSSDEIVAAALQAASPEPGLRWLDVGCGTGNVLRAIRDQHQPEGLFGIDVVDFLDDDLRTDVSLSVGPAESALTDASPADRVLMVETIEHMEGPWTVLRAAARLVRSGGVLVVTTPNVLSLRHRIELLTRGQLTAFRPDHPPHLTPALPHVTARIMQEEGLATAPDGYAGRDVVPGTGGRLWARAAARRFPTLGNISVVVAGSRNGGG